ncbi:polysaccharide biosynthesis tyrosine autokinase [Corynebacterium marinum]|uniref:non-specific protein-tyrosine kinase n=1 Tax=Corynebacterium marinum DSM 44953 TaxID=1224162 RepID=A0A0B6TT43_9CORY|nr:polysaccharide biosynthesis tyrosine autokinase [Corynebacterium marinum]AJK69399.1 chromosome partitioning ATPase [Corynebacterium marinum DSM 44953]GGO21827.1 chromosome partitioning protein [Corynebacterium marinum]
MELREYLSILRKSWVLVVVFAILGLGAGAGASLLATPEYQSRTQLYVSVRSDGGTSSELVQGANYSRQIVNSYVAVVKTGVVLDPVVEQLQLDMTGAELASYVSAASPADSALINITATSPSAEQAAQIADAVGESFQEVVRTQLEPETENGASPVSLTTTQNALVPGSPVSPNVLINLALGLLVGLAVGYGIAILRTVLDRRIHSAQDIEQITDKPLLGRIIDDPNVEKNRIIVNSQPHSPRAESFRALRTNLQFLNVGSKGRVFVVTSPSPSEGKTTTSLNLAYALAQAGSRVAVVEGDLRLPKFSDYLGIEGGAGLTDVLIGRADLEDVLQRWGQDQFFVLPAGRIPPNPSELLGSAEMGKTLEALREQFDYVIVDAPPVLAVTDATVLGKMTAGLLVVVAADATTKQELEDALGSLETTGTDVLGLVATMVPSKGSDSYSYGGYGYGGGAPATPVDATPAPVHPQAVSAEQARGAGAK